MDCVRILGPNRLVSFVSQNWSYWLYICFDVPIFSWSDYPCRRPLRWDDRCACYCCSDPSRRSSKLLLPSTPTWRSLFRDSRGHFIYYFESPRNLSRNAKGQKRSLNYHASIIFFYNFKDWRREIYLIWRFSWFISKLIEWLICLCLRQKCIKMKVNLQIITAIPYLFK